MAGAKWAQKIQLGQEATAGTAVAADVVWRGEGGMLEDLRETIVVPELVGVPMPSSRTYAGKLGGKLAMAATPATPEQLPHILEAGIKQVNTGVVDGTGTGTAVSSGYTYTYAMGASAANTISSYTIETGDNEDAEEMEYSFVQSFELAAVAGEAVTMSANWIGRRVQGDGISFTGALSVPSVSHLLASNSSLWIDDDSGAFGGTAVAAGNILSWKLTVNTGWRGKWTVDSGQLYFNFAYYDRDSFNAQLEITFEHDNLAVAEKANWRADATRLYRIEVTGDAYTAAGVATAFSGYKGLRIDLPGRYTKFNALDSQDGNSIIVATLQGGYDEISTEVLSILVANELAAVP